MKLLAIDTSGPVCGVAILDDDTIRYEATAVNKMTHSVNLLPMVDTALADTGLSIAEMDRLAVTVGPGSFTGVRLGVSTVKGLAYGADKPCVAVDALEAMAAGIADFNGIVCPIQDARAGQVYGAAFSVAGGVPDRLLPDAPIRLEDFVASLQHIGDRFLFLGDGMPVHRERLAAMLGDSAVFTPPQLSYLRPASVAFLASRAVETVDYRTLMPLYLRPPHADKNKKLLEAMAHDQ